MVEHWHQSLLNHGIWHQWISMPVPEDLNHEDWTVETSNQTLKLIIPIWFLMRDQTLTCLIAVSYLSHSLLNVTPFYKQVLWSLPLPASIQSHLYIPNFELPRIINGFISTAFVGVCIRPNSSQQHPCVSHTLPQPLAASLFKWLELLGDGLVGFLVFFSPAPRKNTWVMRYDVEWSRWFNKTFREI